MTLPSLQKFAFPAVLLALALTGLLAGPASGGEIERYVGVLKVGKAKTEVHGWQSFFLLETSSGERFQLAGLDEDLAARLKKWVNKPVAIAGEMMEAHTVHHHTPTLIVVDEVIFSEPE